MQDLATQILARLPPHHPGDSEHILRFLRVWGPKRLPQYLHHLDRLRNGTPWCVYVDSNGARYFTHFKRLAQPVKNARASHGIQKFIARNDNSPAFVF